MALRIRFQYPTGARLGYSIERLADGLLYDPADGTFKAAPSAPILPLPEDSGIFAGRYKATLAPTPPVQFLDGDYCVTVHNAPEASAGIADVVADLMTVMHGGDDATVFPLLKPVGLPPGTYPIKVGPFEGTFTVPTG